MRNGNRLTAVVAAAGIAAGALTAGRTLGAVSGEPGGARVERRLAAVAPARHRHRSFVDDSPDDSYYTEQLAAQEQELRNPVEPTPPAAPAPRRAAAPVGRPVVYVLPAMPEPPVVQPLATQPVPAPMAPPALGPAEASAPVTEPAPVEETLPDAPVLYGSPGEQTDWEAAGSD
jgi:hypothetical protein